MTSFICRILLTCMADVQLKTSQAALLLLTNDYSIPGNGGKLVTFLCYMLTSIVAGIDTIHPLGHSGPTMCQAATHFTLTRPHFSRTHRTLQTEACGRC